MSLALAPGTAVLLHGQEHRIAEVNRASGCVTLHPDSGEDLTMSVEDVVNHPNIAAASGAFTPQDAAVDRLSQRHRKILHERIAHVYEAETGYRSGDPTHPLAHEPRSCYDPALTSLTSRRSTKARELDTDAARFAGISMSYSTIRRIGAGLQSGQSLDAVVDRRHVRRPAGHVTVTESVEQACEEVFERTRLTSNTSMRGRYMLVRQYMREVHRAEHAVPSESTIKRWFNERFIPSELSGKARSRRSATTAPVGGFSRPNPTRPGELVCIDTCSLDVLLQGTAYAGAIRGSVVLAMDWYSRSILAIRVVEGAERAIDVTFVLREIGRPKAMLPGSTDDNRWPYVGLPQTVLTDVYGDHNGHGFAGLPLVNAEAVVTDHGTTYKAHVNVATAAQHGISLLPARVRSGSDKQVVERTFQSLQTMLLAYLSGFRGSDSSERGENVEAEVKYTVQDIEDRIVHWAVRIWQNHSLSDARPDWCPEGEFSPNTLYQYALAQTGQPLRMLTSNDYYALLPTTHVKVNTRGVKLRNLWYDDASDNNVLDGVRNTPAPYGGAVKGKWTVKYDPRDLRRVFFLDKDGVYQTLTWTGATKFTPCFNDRHAAALFKLRRERGIAPHSQDQLAEILLTEVLGVHERVEGWKTLSKTARKEISKRTRQESLVTRDQAGSGIEPFADTVRAQEDPDELDDMDEQAPALAVLGRARARRRAAVTPPATQAGIAPAQRLGSSTPMFGFDAAALIAARALTAPSADPPELTDSQEQK